MALRIIYNNLADTATITANTTATGFSTSNMQNTLKTSVHRTTGTTATYTLTWTTDQALNGIALPATNLQDGATIKVELYSSSDNSIYTAVALPAATQACAGRVKDLYNKSSTYAPTYVDFGFGAAAKTSFWFDSNYTNIRRVIITLTNSTTIDCARIVCGKYWESSRQVSNGIELGFTDSSEITTTRSGNTYEDRKPISETMGFELGFLNDTDRKQLQTLMRSWGSTGLIYYCVFPDNTNPEVTQSYSIYGRSNSNSLQYQFFSLYNTNLEITGW
jgi:hypothetical protein